jgi:hypothetical protein
MATEEEKEIAREKFAVAVTFLLLVPLLLMGFFFIVLGLKLEVFDWQTVIMIDAFMTFGYIILWFLVKGYLLKYFKGSKSKVKLSDEVKAKRPAKPLIKKEKKESKWLKKILKKEKKDEKKRERWKPSPSQKS